MVGACLVAVLCGAFTVLRFGIDDATALVVSQLLFLAAPAAAAVLSVVAARRAPKSSRARVVWAVLAASTAIATASEALYAYNVVLGLSTSGPVGSSADALNILGMLGFMALIGTVAQFDRIGLRRLLQTLFDVLIVLVLSFTLVYRFGVATWMARSDMMQLADAVRHAVYSSVGIVMMVGVLFCVVGLRGRARVWDGLLFGALFTFGLAVTLWPLWSISTNLGVVWPLAEPTVVLLYLLAYCLAAVAAYARLHAADESWQIAVSFERPRLVWPGMVSATLIFATVGFLAWTVLAPAGAAVDQTVYFMGVSVAAVAMVGRTALMTIELDEARESSQTDSLTGAFNSRRLTESVESLMAVRARFGEPFAIAMVDVDDLERLNRTAGTAVGDAVLTELAAVLAVSCGGREHVFRLSGDEFAVLIPGADARGAEAVSHRILSAVDTARPADRPVSVSIGFAACAGDVRDSHELLMRAESAQQWAKHHGKHRVVGFDEQAVRIAAEASPLAALREGPPVDIARALSAAADARDPANYHHSRNVAALAQLLARASGLDDEHVHRIEVAGLLHDVGKIALPDTMLGGRTLPFRDRRRAEEHAALGGRLVEALGAPGVSEWVRAHHERWDGKGYPDGLTGEEIPLEARIIALADAYDGMTTGKRYGAPMSKAAALQEIDLGIGARFDPELAELFITVVGSTGALGWSDGWTAA